MAGSRIKGITIELNGDATGLNKALSGVDKNIANAQKSLRDVNKLLKLDPSNTQLLAQKQELLQSAIKETKTRLHELKTASEEVGKTAKDYDNWKAAYDPIQNEIEETKKKITDLKQTMGEMEKVGDIDTQAYKNLQNELKESNTHLKDLKQQAKEVNDQFGNPISTEQYDALQREIIETEQDLKNLENTAGSSSAKMAEASAKTGDFGKKAESAGKKLMPVSTIIAATGAASTKYAIDIESAMTGVRKTVDTTEEGYQKLKQAAVEMSQTKAISQEDILSVMELGGQLGIAADDLADFAGIIADLDVSTNLDAETAATELAQLANITGMTADEYRSFGDVLVALGNNSAATEADIMNMAMRIAGSGTQVGMTEDQILALSASLASVGIEAEAGGTAISSVMSQIDKDVALGTENMATWAETAGMSAEEFKTAWETDAAGALQTVLVGMGDASKGGENLNLILDSLGVTSLRQTDAMKRLSNNADGMTESFALASKEWENGSALSDEAGKQYENTAAKMQQAGESIKNAGEKIGAILLPIIAKIMEKVAAVADKFSNLDKNTQGIILTILAVVAAAAPLLIAIGKISTGISSVLGLMSKAKTAGQLGSIFTKIGGAFTKVGGVVKTVAGGIGAALKGLFSVVMAHPIIAVITVIIGAVILLYQKCEWFRDAVNAVWGVIKDAFHAAWDGIVTFFTETIPGAWNAVVEFFQGIPDWWQGLWQQVSEFFANTWDTILQNPAIQAIVTTLTTLWENAKNTLSGIWDGLVSIASGVWELLKNTILAPVLLLIDLVTGDFTKLSEDAQNIWNNIKNAAETIWNGAKEIVTTIAKGIKDGAIDAFKAMVKGIGNALDKIGDAVKKGFQVAIDFIKSLPAKAVGWGKDFINGLKDGILSRVNAIVRAVKNVANKIRSFLHFSRPDEGPLRYYEKWMPDFMGGLANGIRKNEYKVSNAMKALSGKMAELTPSMNVFASANEAQVNLQAQTTVNIGNHSFDNYIGKTSVKYISKSQAETRKARGY